MESIALRLRKTRREAHIRLNLLRWIKSLWILPQAITITSLEDSRKGATPLTMLTLVYLPILSVEQMPTNKVVTNHRTSSRQKEKDRTWKQMIAWINHFTLTTSIKAQVATKKAISKSLFRSYPTSNNSFQISPRPNCTWTKFRRYWTTVISKLVLGAGRNEQTRWAWLKR